MSKAAKRSSPSHHEIINAMSVDVEEFFQVGAFETCIAKEDWDGFESRVERATHDILDLFDAYGVKASFFCLGWIAERHPSLIQRIVKDGHELASHGYDHARVFTLNKREFREDVLKTHDILSTVSGASVHGYRAPSFSIDERSAWAHDVLGDLGYRYSSSVYPVKTDHYGMPDAPRFAYRPRDGSLVEVPMTTVKVLGRQVPSSGGGYFRLLPYQLSKYLISKVNKEEGQAAIFYMHPWEVDPGQPRQDGAPLKSRFRHYVNLSQTKAKLEHLLQDFRWGRMDHVFLND